MHVYFIHNWRLLRLYIMLYFNFSVASFNWRTIMCIECENHVFSVVTVFWHVNDTKAKTQLVRLLANTAAANGFWFTPHAVSTWISVRRAECITSRTWPIKTGAQTVALMYMHWRHFRSRVTEPPLRLGSIEGASGHNVMSCRIQSYHVPCRGVDITRYD